MTVNTVITVYLRFEIEVFLDAQASHDLMIDPDGLTVKLTHRNQTQISDISKQSQ